jgi:hypothetical protein
MDKCQSMLTMLLYQTKSKMSIPQGPLVLGPGASWRWLIQSQAVKRAPTSPRYTALTDWRSSFIYTLSLKGRVPYTATAMYLDRACDAGIGNWCSPFSSALPLYGGWLRPDGKTQDVEMLVTGEHSGNVPLLHHGKCRKAV